MLPSLSLPLSLYRSIVPSISIEEGIGRSYSNLHYSTPPITIYDCPLIDSIDSTTAKFEETPPLV